MVETIHYLLSFGKMATNIFSPFSGKTYSYGSNLGNTNAAYNIWGSNGTNPYYINSPGYTPSTPETLGTNPLPENVRSVLPGGSDSWVDPDTSAYGPGVSTNSLTGNYLTNYFSQPSNLGLAALLPGVGVVDFFSGLATNIGADWDNAQVTETDYFGNPVSPGTTVGDINDTSGYSESGFSDWGAGSGWDSYSDFQDDTGIGTSDWDSSADGFSW